MKTDRLFQALYQLPDFPNSLKAGRARGDAFRKRVDELVVRDTLPNDQVLLSKGQREDTMYFLESGFARGFSYDKKSGKEDTQVLWNDLCFVASLHSFYQQQASGIFIQICAGAKIVSATFRDMEEVFTEYPEGVVLTRSVSLQHKKANEWREYLLAKLNPQERYQALLEKFPRVMQYFSAETIASFLAIAPETLSRVRNAKS